MANENYIFGMHPVMEAIKANKEIDKVFIQSDLRGPHVMVEMECYSLGMELLILKIRNGNLTFLQLTKVAHLGWINIIQNPILDIYLL